MWQVLIRIDMFLKSQLLEVHHLGEPKFDPDALLTSDTILCGQPRLDPALMSISTLPSQAASGVWV